MGGQRCICEGNLLEDWKCPIHGDGNKSALSDGLCGEQVLAELRIWIKYKKAVKENENRKFDKGYKYALDDIYDKIDEIKGTT